MPVVTILRVSCVNVTPMALNPPPSHSWSSLLTERWHRSSRVVFWLVLVLLLFCNFPGQFKKEIDYEVGSPFPMRERWVHGWPCTFLERDALVHHANPLAVSPTAIFFYHPTLQDCFSLRRDVREVFWWLLALNLACAPLISLAVGLSFEIWRRQRTRLFQIHLRDCLLASLLASGVAAWCVRVYRPWAIEERLKSQVYRIPYPPLTVTRQQRCTWFDLCAGEARWLEPFNPPLGLQIWHPDAFPQLQHFSSAKVVEITSVDFVSTEDLAHLTELPKLEAIHYTGQLSTPRRDAVKIDRVVGRGKMGEGDIVGLPSLPNLRGLSVFIPAKCCRRLDRLTGLEYLCIGNDYVDDEALREIGQLRKLRHVELHGLEASADVSFLPSLPNLAAAYFYNSQLEDDAVQHISRCSGLMKLSLYCCKVDDGCIRHLTKLTKLQKLDVDQTQIKDIDALQRALPNCEIHH